MDNARLDGFFAALEARHLASLTFQEVRRALTALSSVYVERRDKLGGGAALDGAGKRAAFAMYYGPMHYAVACELQRELGASGTGPVVDLGCGTGVVGAAWAIGAGAKHVLGLDVSRWVVDEARWTYAHFGLAGEARAQDIRTASWPVGASIVCGYTANELPDPDREKLLTRLCAAVDQGASLLVLEPIAKRDRPWWPEWERELVARGGRADEWRFRLEMPERWRLLGKAAGLRPEELKARTLYVPGR